VLQGASPAGRRGSEGPDGNAEAAVGMSSRMNRRRACASCCSRCALSPALDPVLCPANASTLLPPEPGSAHSPPPAVLSRAPEDHAPEDHARHGRCSSAHPHEEEEESTPTRGGRGGGLL